MRLVPLAAAVVASCLLVLAPAAHAYKRQPFKWPTRTIPYYNGATTYKSEVADAARAWNRSGSKVRWTAVPRSRAKVVVKVEKKLPVAGLATVTFFGRRFSGLIQLQPDLRKGRPPLAGRAVAAQVIVHEMGHIMGLDHETRACAIMQPVLGLGCPDASEPWRYRCRLLEKDDIRGGVALFGGKVGRLGAEFCDLVPAPPAPTGVEIAPAPAGEEEFSGPRVSWTTPAGAEYVRVLRRRDACPTDPDAAAQQVAHVEATPGQPQSVEDFSGFEGPGRYCYAVFAVGELNRPSAAATQFFDYTGPVSQEFRPNAYFDAIPDEPDPMTIRFVDDSSAGRDRQLVAWAWDFGDGTSSAERNPVHRYGTPSEEGYEVILTVTDDQGDSATYRARVYPSPPIEDHG